MRAIRTQADRAGRRGRGLALASTLGLLVLVGLVLIASPASTRMAAPAAVGDAGCQSCGLFGRYAQTLDQSELEVGAIANGIVLYFAASDPDRVVDLQRFAFEREKLHRTTSCSKGLDGLCDGCRERTVRIRGSYLDVANSARGVFTILVSDDPDVVGTLHEMASEIALHNDVRGS